MDKDARKVLIDHVNQAFRLEDLLAEYLGADCRPGATVLCPFHTDSRKSAKFYADNAIYCFTEAKMYRPYDLLRFVGKDDAAIAALCGKVELVSRPQKPVLSPEYWNLRSRARSLSLEQLLKAWKLLQSESNGPPGQ